MNTIAPPRPKVTEAAQGRWRSILPALGIDREHLTGKHGPCPLCKDGGGKDRFRFDDKDGTGSYFCNTCGPGSGVDLVMKRKGVDFAKARELIEAELPGSTFELPKAQTKTGSYDLSRFWGSCHKLNGFDAACLYLAKRGLKLPAYPAMLRFHPAASYLHDDKRRTQHPAMVAKYVAPDAKDFTLHTTFLTPEGDKASVPLVRKTAARAIPRGGAVRLASSAETMGIAEGIETALSAMALFDVPVWSTLNSGQLATWEPPPTARNIIVFGDCDGSYGGQVAAFGLAHRLKAKGYHVDVRFSLDPCEPPTGSDDWNDALERR